MATNPFSNPDFGSDLLKEDSSANPFSDPNFDGSPPARGFKGWAQDAAATAVKGAISVPEAIVGLADIPTGGRVGKFLENKDGAFGFRPDEAKAIANDWHSDATKEAQRKFQEADGIWDKTKTAVQNPSLIATTVGESLPSMIAGGAIGRGLLAATKYGAMAANAGRLSASEAAALKAAQISAGAAGEGATMAGSAAEQIRQQTDDRLLSPTQAAAAAGTGVMGGVVSRLSGGLANKLGIGEADTMLTQGARGVVNDIASAKSIPRQVIEGAVTEGLLEELPQSVGEQILQNLALNKNWAEGLDDAVVMGTLSGGLMGSGAAGLHGFMAKGGAPALTPEQSPAQHRQPAPEQPLQLGNNPDPLIQFRDGTVARQSEIDAHLASLPERERQTFVAQILGYAPQQADEKQLTTSPGAAAFDGNANQQQAASVAAPDFGTSLGAQPEPQGGGLEFQRQIDTSGLSLERLDSPFAKSAPATALDRQALARQGAYPISPTPAPVLDTRRLSEKLGLSSNNGGLESAAAYAVDSGATPIAQALNSQPTGVVNGAQAQEAQQAVAGQSQGAGAQERVAAAPKIRAVKLKDGTTAHVNEVDLTSGASQLRTFTADGKPRAARLQATHIAPAAPKVVLQNRNRATPASIAQMNAIAGKPDYLRTGASNTMDNGAPIVFGDLPQKVAIGRAQMVADGNGQRVPTQYAVVEAQDLITSNHADGSPVAEYANGVDGKLRAVAGNGRAAGLKAAWQRGTAGQYGQELVQDAPNLGIAPEVLAQFEAPVLVRVMDAADVTPDMGDRSNVQAGLQMSAVEQASNDAQRLNLRDMEFDELGNPTAQTVMRFMQGMPVQERGNMLDSQGRATSQLLDRIRAAAFKQAYMSDSLVELAAQSADPEAKNILNGLAIVAGDMAQLAGAGDFDIRQTVADAANMAVTASRTGQSMAQYLQTRQIDENPETVVVMQFMAQNVRSAKRIADGLRAWAELAQSQIAIARQNAEQDTMFGDTPTLSRRELFERLNNDNLTEIEQQQLIERQRRAELAEQGTQRPSTERAGNADGASDGAESRGTEPTNAQDAGREQADFALEQQTPEQIRAQEEAQAQAARDKAKEDAQAAEAERKAVERQEVTQRSEAAANDFQLGQSAEDNLSGQSDIFSSAPAQPESKPKNAKEALERVRAKKAAEKNTAAVAKNAVAEPVLSANEQAIKNTQDALTIENTRSRLTAAYNKQRYRDNKKVEDYQTLRSELEELANSSQGERSRLAQEVLEAIDGAIGNLEMRKRWGAEQAQPKTATTTQKPTNVKEGFERVRAKKAAEKAEKTANEVPVGASGEQANDLAFSRNTGRQNDGIEGVRDLVVLHNLTEDNLRNAAKIGGLPVPSLGIAKAETPFSGYGNITLIGTRDMIDPQQGVPVYDRDAYTARFPEMHYKKPKRGNANALYERMQSLRELGDDGSRFQSMLFDILINSSSPTPARIAELFDRYNAPRMLYAQEVLGKTIKTPMRDVQASTLIGHDKELVRYWQKHRETFNRLEGEMDGAAFRGTPEYKAFEKEIHAAINRVKSHFAQDDDATYKRISKRFTDSLFPNGHMDIGTRDRLIRDFGTYGKKEIDVGKLNDSVDKTVKRGDAGYTAWVNKQMAGLFDEPTITLRGKQVAPTLDNLVAAMTIGGTVGAEKTMTASAGKTSAMLGKRFKSVAEIQAARAQVVSSSQENDAKKSNDEILAQYRTSALAFFTKKDRRGEVDTWAGLDASMEALANAGKKGGADAAIRQALAAKGFRGVDAAVIDLAKQSIDALRNSPTEYFEAKPQRAVGIGEFRGAVLPRGTDPNVLELLAKHGVQVLEYGKGEGAREKAIATLAKRLDRGSRDVLFSATGDGAANLRTKPKGATTSTIRHAASRAYGKLLERLEAKGLVHVAQTEEDALQAAAKARAAKTGQSVAQELNGLRQSVQNSIAVWHGTPHRGIERTGFKLNKIGTGEGAQAYGWGIYFASQRVVAEGYRQSTSRPEVEIGGRRFKADGGGIYRDDTGIPLGSTNTMTHDDAARGLYGSKANQPIEVLAEEAESYLQSRSWMTNERIAEAKKAILNGEVKLINEGQLYSADIPENDELLDWDKPLSEQPQNVLDALKSAGILYKPSMTGSAFYQNIQRNPTHYFDKVLSGLELTEAYIYPDRGASMFLNALGIPGLRYLDGNSRIKGEGSHNYVIWDEALLTPEKAQIDAMYSKGGAIEGFFDRQTGKSFLVADGLTEETAPATLMHEVGIHMAADGSMQGVFNRAAMLVKNSKDEFMNRVRDRMEAAGETSAEEAAAYIVTEYEKDRTNAPASIKQFMKDFLAAVRAWLFRNGFTQVVKEGNLTPADISAIARANAKSLANGENRADAAQNLRKNLAFSEAGSIDSAALQRQFDETARAYGGQDAYDKAKADGKTKLNYGQWVQVRTPAFKAWFGDWENDPANASKVIDRETGEPMVAYHGTDSDISLFDGNKTMDGSFWFTNDPKKLSDGEVGAAANGVVMPVYLQSKKLAGWDEYDSLTTDQLIQEGFDGVKLDEDYIIFNPEQIKSATGNNGSFDGANPDIRFSRASPTTGAGVWQAPEATQFDNFAYLMQDKQIDAKRVIAAIKETGAKIIDALDVYLRETLYHGRTAKRVKDFAEQEERPLMELMRDKGLSLGQVEEYLHARHAPEANKALAERNPSAEVIAANLKAAQAAGDEGEAAKWRNAKPYTGTEEDRLALSGMSDAEAAAVMAALTPEQRTNLQAAAKMVDAIVAKTRQTFVDYGLETQETVDAWGKAWAHYVPLMREQPEDTGMAGMGTGQGFSVKGKEVKGRTGSTKKVVDILANINMQRERAIVRGEKNRVAMALLGLVKANPNKDFWRVATAGEVPSSKVVDERTGLVRTQIDPLYKSRDNALVVKVDGQEQVILFNEDNARAMRMAAALKNMDAANLEGMLGNVAIVTRYLAAINTQYNPIFGIVNMVRDFQEAAINLQTTPLAGKQKQVLGQALTAVWQVGKELRAQREGKTTGSEWGKLWDEFQNEGGQTGYRDMFANSADRSKALQAMLKPDAWADGKLGKFFTANGTLKAPMEFVRKSALRPVLDLLSDYNEAIENGVRLSAYKAALDHGLSKARAAELAKNLTVNFNRKGQTAQQMGALYAFFNASVQGTARMGKTLFDMEPGKPKTLRLSSLGKKIVTGGVLLGSVQALLLAGAGFDEDEPPEFIRERNLVIPNPMSDKGYITIPMPLGYHVLSNIGRIPTEYALGGFKNGGKRAFDLLDVLADIYNPLGGSGLSMQTITPSVIDPLAALAENRDFSGRAIAKVSFDKTTPGHALGRDTSSMLAQGMAQVINYATGGTEYTRGELSPTPDQIDYLIGQVTGGVGREASKVSQSTQAIATGDELPWHKVPLAGRFYGSADTPAAAQSAYYNTLDDVRRHAAEVKGLRNDGRGQDAIAYMQKHPQAAMHIAANRAETTVKKLRDRISELKEQDAPREQVKALEMQMTEVMQQFSAAITNKKKSVAA